MSGSGTAVTFTSGDRRLRGELVLPDRAPEMYLLFVHGLGSSRTGYLPRAQSASSHLGAATLVFDLSGHGESEGVLERLTPADHLSDVVAAYDLLVGSAPSSGPAGPRVGVCGASYGAYLSAILPSLRDVSRLLLRAPALYPDDLVDVPLSQERHTGVVRSPTLVTRSADSLRGRVLVVESQDDSVIPHDVVEQYLALFPGSEHALIRGAGHALLTPEHRAEFLELVLRWFGRPG